MNLRDCDCGLAPMLHISRLGAVYFTQVVCKCGEQTAKLSHSRPEDHARMQQVAIDAWNLGGPW